MKRLQSFGRKNAAELICFLAALVLDVTIELMYRKSLSEFWAFLSARPLAFLENVLILTLMLSLCLFFKKKWFFGMLVGAGWAALGVTNMLLLGYRISPLSAIDFSILQLDWSFIHIYASVGTVAAVILAIVLLIIGLVLLFIKCPRMPVHPLRSVVMICILLLVTVLVPELPFTNGFAGNTYKDVINLTEQYGFVYSFSRSVVDRGIDRPEDYSARRMHTVANEILNTETAEKDDTPNVIFLQMESFFDVKYLKGVEFAEDPIPCFTELKETGSSGFFTAPSIGAGTANTEFEVLTQMDVHMFGTGEYPYKTVLQEGTCESLAYILKEYGLSTHAIHNNTATFYDRNLVYPNLGFDTFTPLEHMSDMTYTQQGWAEDRVLVGEIIKTLASTEERDFVYAISVQPHGPYPEEAVEGGIEVVSGVEDEAQRNGLSFYAGQLRAVDDVLRELTEMLSECDEPTVLVAFGDHMPAVEIEESMLEQGTPYTTEYVIWANFEIEAERKDVAAYQLASHVFEKIGINGGVLTKFHQLNNWNGAYLTELEALQYDMLYGDKVVYHGETPYETTEMQFGIEEIVLESATIRSDTLTARGENFTSSSVICLNGDPQETEFVSENEIRCECKKLPEDAKVSVKQIAEDGTVLSTASAAKNE